MKSLNLPYNPRIDQLRWLAATIVFVFHFYLEYQGLGGQAISNPWFGIITEGHTGVGLFFTLSGFLFMQIAQRQQVIGYGDFMRNRFLRIFPLFFTVFLLATSIGRDKFQPQDIFYLLATNLGQSPTSGSLITGAAWCISIEFMFYALFPFLARFTMERGARYLVSLLALMLFFKVAAFTVSDKSTLMYSSTFVGRFDQFLIGMGAALVYQRYHSQLQRHAGWFLPLALAFAIGNSALQNQVASYTVLTAPKSQFWIVWSMLESTGWACVILAWVGFGKTLPGWLERMLNHGGKISFSFYLLHMAMLHVLALTVGKAVFAATGVVWLNALLLFTGAYAATWALATLSYNTIEEPFLNMRRRYGSTPQPVADVKG